MRMRYYSPLLVTLFGLVLSASAQEATSFAKTRGKLLTHSYPVAELVVPLNPATASPVIHLLPSGVTCTKEPCCAQQVQAAPCPGFAYCAPSKACDEKATCEDRLIKLIQNTISPHCWSCNGGKATMEYNPLGRALIVNAEADVQAQVADLLQALRRKQDTSVMLEVRVISVADGILERTGIDCHEGTLNAKQVMQLLEAIQGDQRTNVCTTPRVTMFNGHKATIKVGSEQSFGTGMDIDRCEDKEVKRPRQQSMFTGLVLTVQPTVSAHDRTIQLKLRAEHSQLVPGAVPMFHVTGFFTPVFEGVAASQPFPFTQYVQRPCFNVQAIEKIMAVPDGGTVVIGGMKFPCKVEQECATPILSKVPYLNRLFKAAATRHEMENTVILVTPRVIVQKEEECQPAPVTSARTLPTPPLVKEDQQIKPARFTVPMIEAVPMTVNRTGSSFRAVQVAKLMEMYHEACAGGHTDEARKLAAFALELDPTCFSKQRR